MGGLMPRYEGEHADFLAPRIFIGESRWKFTLRPAAVACDAPSHNLIQPRKQPPVEKDEAMRSVRMVFRRGV